MYFSPDYLHLSVYVGIQVAYLAMVLAINYSINRILIKLKVAPDIRKLVRVTSNIVWVFFGILVAFFSLPIIGSTGHLF